MRRPIGTLSAFVLLFGSLDAQADNREVVLNYADPHGAALAVALVTRADRIPEWMRDGPTPDGDDTGSHFAVMDRSTADASRTTYMFSARRSTSEAASGFADGARIELPAGPGRAVEIRRTSNELANLPPCMPRSEPRVSCRVSDLGRDILAFAIRYGTSPSARFDALLSAHRLVEDDRAAKRVVATLDAGDQVSHVDFVGMVRGRDEELPAPDATSVYVVRLGQNGVFTVVERSRDSSADPARVKFAFEGQ